VTTDRDRVLNLSTLRRMRLWSQSDLAREAGVATSTISNIETGKATRLRPTVMRRIAKALGVNDPLTVYELRISILGDGLDISGERHDPE
jgi:transcriptional regulator with XRE-family HTH domain